MLACLGSCIGSCDNVNTALSLDTVEQLAYVLVISVTLCLRHIDAVALGTMGHLQNECDYGARRSMKMKPAM